MPELIPEPMFESRVRQGLARVAELAGDRFDPPSIGVFAARRRRRYRTVGAVCASAATVVAVAVAVGVATNSSAPRPRALGSVGVSASAGHVTVDQLRTYQWRVLPDAPIETRETGVAGVWTGDRMLVWGGQSGEGDLYADGASYDPATRTWHRIAASPLSPRADPAYVWTGTRLFVWGGTDADRHPVTADGALYDPATDSWQQLPPLEVDDHTLARAVWTGSQVVLFTAAEPAEATTVDVHAYDPAANAWTSLASIHIAQTGLLDLQPLAAGNQLYLWMPVQTIETGGLRTGNDAFRYQPGTNSWQSTDLLPTGFSVGTTQWTGDHIIFDPNGVECTCGGVTFASTGSWADPASGTVAPIPAWTDPPYVPSTFIWTGAAILALHAAEAAAWDPSTNKWTPVAGPPESIGAVRIWTGIKLLIWGALATTLPPSDPNNENPPPGPDATGIEFTP